MCIYIDIHLYTWVYVYTYYIYTHIPHRPKPESPERDGYIRIKGHRVPREQTS